MTLTKVVIIEDEQLIAEDLRETLEILGYEVPSVMASGEAAIESILEFQPDLVLMDICLAGEIDGIAASEIIQSQYHIPVIYLTANTDPATLERAKASQPFGYILKPFNEHSLGTTIEIAMARHQAEVSVHDALTHAQVAQQTSEALLQQKSNYLHLVAHELRNPLTAIKFASEVLINSNVEIADDRRQRYIQRIFAATKNLNEMLEDVLLLEKSSSTELEFVPTKINLDEFCQDLIETFQLNGDTNHQFRLGIEGDAKSLNLDAKLLWHLFSNLVSNAVKYSPQGGIVSLSICWQPTSVQVSITDQGIGIPPETQARLFEPFQRGGNVGVIPGTGLGLAIAKRCVELQGGTISVQSEVNQGTTFIVTFPMPSFRTSNPEERKLNET